MADDKAKKPFTLKVDEDIITISLYVEHNGRSIMFDWDDVYTVISKNGDKTCLVMTKNKDGKEFPVIFNKCDIKRTFVKNGKYPIGTVDEGNKDVNFKAQALKYLYQDIVLAISKKNSQK